MPDKLDATATECDKHVHFRRIQANPFRAPCGVDFRANVSRTVYQSEVTCPKCRQLIGNV